MFGLTNFWDKEIYPNNIGLEEKQGKLMADVAKENGVKLFIWRYTSCIHLFISV